MATRPSDFPVWASTLQAAHPVSGQPNKVIPDAAHQNLGYDFREKPPRQYINWILDNLNLWVQWLDQENEALDFKTRFITGYSIGVSSGSANYSMNSGVCRDYSDSLFIANTSSVIKDVTSAWAQGTGNGGYAGAGAIAGDTWYYVFVIYKDGEPVDSGVDSDINATNLLAASTYTNYRRIGVVKTNAGATQLLAMNSMEDHFFFSDQVSESISLNGQPASFAVGSVYLTPNIIRHIQLIALSAPSQTNIFVNLLNWFSGGNLPTPSAALHDAGHTSGGVQTCQSRAFVDHNAAGWGSRGLCVMELSTASTGTIDAYALGWVDYRDKDGFSH